MKNENKKNKKANPLPILIALVFGVSVGIIAARTAIEPDISLLSVSGWLRLVFAFIVIYIAYLIEVIIHESGHLIFGLISGYKLISFRIMGLMLIRSNGKWRLAKYSVAGTGGQCLMSPPEDRGEGFPVVLYNFGGVITNAVSSIIFLVLTFSVFKLGYLHTFFLSMALFGLMNALLNGIPLKTASIGNDGYNGISLRGDPEARASLRKQLIIYEGTANGKRLSELPEEWFSLPEDAELSNVMHSTVALNDCLRLLDMLDFPAAEEKLLRLLESGDKLIGLHKFIADCQLIAIYSLRGELDRAKALLTAEARSMLKLMKGDPTSIRTNYIVHTLLEPDYKKRADDMDRFEGLERTYPFKQELIIEKKLIEMTDNVRFSSQSCEENAKTEETV